MDKIGDMIQCQTPIASLTCVSSAPVRFTHAPITGSACAFYAQTYYYINLCVFTTFVSVLCVIRTPINGSTCAFSALVRQTCALYAQTYY
jgi:hypothetical protein